MNRTRLSRRAFLGAAGGVAAGGWMQSLAAAPLAKLIAAGRMRIAVYRDFEPWSWRDDKGRLVGIDVDLGQAIADALKLKVEMVDFLADEDMGDDLRNMVWRGTLIGQAPCDILMHVPVDRKLQLDNDRVVILGPYYREGFGMVCNRETTDCEVQPPQLKGKALVAEIDSIPDFYLSGGFGGVLRADVRHLPSGAAAVSAIVKGEADAAVATRAQIEHGLSIAKGDRAVTRKGPMPALPSAGWNIGVAVKDDSRDLGDRVEAIVAELMDNGTVAKIFAAYGVSPKAPLVE